MSDSHRRVDLPSLGFSEELWKNFELTGDTAGLDLAIALLRTSARSEDTDAHVRPAILSNLGAALLRRWDRFGEMSDLEEAVSALRHAVAGSPVDSGTHVAALSNLGAALLKVWSQRGEAATLDKAISVLEAALTVSMEGDPVHGSCLSNLGVALVERWDATGEAAALDRAIAAHRAAVGRSDVDDVERAAAMSKLAEALRLRSEQIGQQAEEDIAELRDRLNREAADIYARVLQLRFRLLGADHPATLASMNNVAAVMHDRGELRGAREIYEQALSGYRRILGEDHPDTLTSLNNLAAVIQDQGELDTARKLYEQVLLGRRRILGEDHPDTLTSLNNLAAVIQDQGELDTARKLYEQVLLGRRRVLGSHHPSTLATVGDLARCRGLTGDVRGAVDTFQELLASQVRVLGPDHPQTFATRTNLAISRGQAGDSARAVDELEQLLDDQLHVLGPDHPQTFTTRTNLAISRGQAGDSARAVDELEQLLDDQLRVLGPDHPQTLVTRRALLRFGRKVETITDIQESGRHQRGPRWRIFTPRRPYRRPIEANGLHGAIVVVPGIGREQLGAATLGQRWRTALADGVWKAGDIELAEQLVRSEHADAIDVAFYADLLQPVDVQGGAKLARLDPVEAAVLEKLARYMLRRAAVAAEPPGDREIARDELARLEGVLGEEHGVHGAVGSGVAGLARLRWYAPFGMAAAQRFVMSSLVQVSRYLHEPGLHDAVLARVAEQMNENTRVLIGHALGSVVAFEAACRLGPAVPLLVTLGSPLGVPIVYDRLRPQPPRFPDRVRRWINVSAHDDIFAAVSDLTDLFEPTRPAAARFTGGVMVESGSLPHDPTHYLSKPAVGDPVAEALR